MSYAIGSNECAELDCHRTRMTTANDRADGPLRYSRCAAHTALRQTHAFGHLPGAALHASPSVGVQLPADRHAAVAVGASGPG